MTHMDSGASKGCVALVFFFFFASFTRCIFVAPVYLQLGIPSSSVRGFKGSISPIPEKRAQLEPLFAATNGMNRALVPKVYIFSDDKTLRVLIRQNY